MNEPKRLLTHGATDFERQLLKSVMNERPSALLRSRMQRGLGLIGPLAWASNVKAMLGTLTTKATVGVSMGGLVVAGGVAAGGVAAASLVPGWLAERQMRDVPAESRPAEPARPKPALTTMPEGADDTAAAELPVQNVEALQEVEADVEANSQLREEIALLDRARVALQQGTRASAVDALDTYRERFPAGILGREAKILRQRAAVKPARVESGQRRERGARSTRQDGD